MYILQLQPPSSSGLVSSLVRAGPICEPDMESIEELLEHIDRESLAQQVHKMLMELYIVWRLCGSCGATSAGDLEG